MRPSIIFLIALFSVARLQAQEEEVYTVKAHQLIPSKVIYALPGFTVGTAFLRDGTTARQPLNYNYLTGEMQFINRGGDTLAIADPGTIKYIAIDTAVFYYEKGFLKQVFIVDSFKLAERQVLTQLPGKIAGGYGTGNEGGDGAQQFGNVTTEAFGTQHLRADKDISFKKVVTYYLGDRFNLFLRADKSTFTHFFSKKKALVEQYIREHNVNFKNKLDLQKLLQFCVM